MDGYLRLLRLIPHFFSFLVDIPDSNKGGWVLAVISLSMAFIHDGVQ